MRTQGNDIGGQKLKKKISKILIICRSQKTYFESIFVKKNVQLILVLIKANTDDTQSKSIVNFNI